MESGKIHPAKLDQECVNILQKAENSINQRLGLETDPGKEVYLIAIKRTRE